MDQLIKALYAAGHKSFDVSIERLIVLLRIILTLLCGVAILTEARPPSPHTQLFEFILLGYTIFGGCVIVLPTIGKFRTGWQLPVHVVDVAVISALMAIDSTISMKFFILYIFVLMSATFRWNLQGALWTTVVVSTFQLISPWGHDDLLVFSLQLGFIAIIGGVFMFFGALRERSADRLSQIAAWPETAVQFYVDDEAPWLTNNLNHIAQTLGTPRVLVFWEIAQEPYRFLALFADGRVRRERLISDGPNQVVSREFGDKTFAANFGKLDEPFALEGELRLRGPIIENSFREKFQISSVCSAAFSGDLCKGRVFLLDLPHWGDDDLIMAEIAASRVRMAIEYYAVWIQLQEIAASRERVRFARDLHDGILQSLTAIGLQLKLKASKSSPGIKPELESLQKIVEAEQKRIRSIIEERPPLSRQRVSKLQRQLQREVARIESRWGCRASLLILPADADISEELARQIKLLLSEAVANAVKHGKAREVKITLEQTSDELSVKINDNGRGIKNLLGMYSHDDLMEGGIGPQSIFVRVAEMGGALSLSSSPKGVDLNIRIPYGHDATIRLSDVPA